MSGVAQQMLPIGEASSLESHIRTHRTDTGFREKVPSSGPTKHLPGTWDKVIVLEQRLKNGEPLWHPDDAKSRRKRSGWESSDVAL